MRRRRESQREPGSESRERERAREEGQLVYASADAYMRGNDQGGVEGGRRMERGVDG